MPLDRPHHNRAIGPLPPPGGRLRFGFVMALAVVLHLAWLWAWQEWRQDAQRPATPSLRVHLLPTGTAPAVQPDSIPAVEPGIDHSSPVRAETAPPRVRTPATTMPAGAERSDSPSAGELLGHLNRYRLTNKPLQPTAPAANLTPSLTLGAPPTGNLLADLDRPLPDLPFADTPLAIRFYAFGPRGDLQRLGDAITREFGFKTPYGTKVSCVWMVVVLACGWK